jgi:hypothetical protein
LVISMCQKSLVRKIHVKDIWRKYKPSLVCWAMQYRKYFQTRWSWWWNHKLIPQTVRISIYITYFAAFVALILYFGIHSDYWKRLLLIAYMFILGAIVFIAIFIFMTLVVCSVSTKGQRWFDKYYHYPISGDTDIENRVEKIEETLKNVATKEDITRLEKKLDDSIANQKQICDMRHNKNDKKK